MRRILTVGALILVILALGIAPAIAHTAFESSNPADGAESEGPIDEIRLVFSGEAEPAGDGFVVLDSSGVRVPDLAVSDDNLTWVLQFNEPLSSGPTGVRWSVAAPDAHPIEGSFSFTVVNSSAEPVATAPTMGSATTGLQEFLETSDPKAPFIDLFGVVARSLSLAGAMLAIGGISFAALVMRGTEDDIRSVLFWVRRAVLLLVSGTIMQLVYQLAVVNGNWVTVWPLSSYVDVLWAPQGAALGLRLVGAVLMGFTHLEVIHAANAADPVVTLQGTIGLGAGPVSEDIGRANTDVRIGEPYVHEGDQAWRVDGELWLVALGIIAAVASYSFDGHTVVSGVHLITALVDAVHVGAGAMWAGGLVMLVHVIWRRHIRGSDVRALQLAVRFSVVAAASLVLAGMAGTVLAVIILDSVSEVWGTPWGRVLVAKVAVVALAGVAGGYNHKVLIPHMMRRPPNDPAANREFRRTVSVEGAAMGVVIVLTAILVGSAS